MRKFFSLGLVRGLLSQIVGTALGIGILTGIRVLFDLSVWKPEICHSFWSLNGRNVFSLWGWRAG